MRVVKTPRRFFFLGLLLTFFWVVGYISVAAVALGCGLWPWARKYPASRTAGGRPAASRDPKGSRRARRAASLGSPREHEAGWRDLPRLRRAAGALAGMPDVEVSGVCSAGGPRASDARVHAAGRTVPGKNLSAVRVGGCSKANGAWVFSWRRACWRSEQWGAQRARGPERSGGPKGDNSGWPCAARGQVDRARTAERAPARRFLPRAGLGRGRTCARPGICAPRATTGKLPQPGQAPGWHRPHSPSISSLELCPGNFSVGVLGPPSGVALRGHLRCGRDVGRVA